MEDLLKASIPILGIISAVALPISATAYIIVLLLRFRYKERMELIKQGIVPNSQPKPIPNKYISLRNGFLCIGLAIGFIVGIVMSNVLNLKTYTNMLMILASVLLFLGIGYVLFFLITKDKNLED